MHDQLPRDLRARREQLGLSREQLAVRAGVASTTIRRAELGQRLHRATVTAILRALEDKEENEQ